MTHPLNSPSRRLAVHQIAAAGLLGLGCIPHVGAQQAGDATASLQPVEVKGQTARGASAAYTTSVIEAEDIANAHVSHPQELLRQVPGMNVQNYSCPAWVTPSSCAASAVAGTAATWAWCWTAFH